MDYFSCAALFKYPNYCGIIVSVLYTSVCMYILYIYIYIYIYIHLYINNPYLGIYIHIYIYIYIYIYINTQACCFMSLILCLLVSV